jgi:hypothetical protein
MWQRSEQSAAPLAKLGRTRLLLGATVATVGLFAALGWVGLPGTQLSLNRDSHGTESIEAREQAARSGSHARPTAKLTSSTSRATSRHAASQLVAKGDTGKTAPRSAGKQLKPSPRAKQPSVPTVGNTPSGSQAGDSTPAPTQQTKQVSSPPPPSPPPSVLPPVEVPQVPQVPVPTVPDLPKPQVPSVTTPQLPTLP